MSTELPDFQSAPAWVDRKGYVDSGENLSKWASNDPECAALYAPFEPLNTADDWASRVDRDKLADVIEVAQWGHHAHSRTTRQAVATAVLAALPELTKEEA